MRDRIANDAALSGGGVDVTPTVGAKHPSVIAAYTHEVEFALLAACLRTPLAVDEAGLVIDDNDFLEPACARLWLLMVNARIECADVDDDRLREALAGLDDADAEKIIHRLRHPLVKPKSITKFARDLKRLARERAA